MADVTLEQLQALKDIPTPAIANAIHKATGVRMNELPMNPASVMAAIWKLNPEKK